MDDYEAAYDSAKRPKRCLAAESTHAADIAFRTEVFHRIRYNLRMQLADALLNDDSLFQVSADKMFVRTRIDVVVMTEAERRADLEEAFRRGLQYSMRMGMPFGSTERPPSTPTELA